MRSPITLVISILLIASALLAQGAALTQAHVTKIINDVKVVDPVKGSHEASLQELIRDQVGLKTGVKSRSELLFDDNTLTRIGPETYFSFKAGTRDLTLEHGIMLLQVPKGIGGAKIRTAAVTASITGTTIMMEYQPAKHIKVLVLEGSLRLSVNGKFGNALLLQPGQMVIMSPQSKKIPDPVTVDLKHLVRTSSLINMSNGKDKRAALPSAALIEKAIGDQQEAKNQKALVETNLVIMGNGTNVVLASDRLIDTLNQRDLDAADSNIAASNSKGDGLGAEPTPAPVPQPTSTPPLPSPTPTNEDHDNGKGHHHGNDDTHGKGHHHGHGQLKAPSNPGNTGTASRLNPPELKGTRFAQALAVKNREPVIPIATSEQLLSIVNVAGPGAGRLKFTAQSSADLGKSSEIDLNSKHLIQLKLRMADGAQVTGGSPQSENKNFPVDKAVMASRAGLPSR